MTSLSPPRAAACRIPHGFQPVSACVLARAPQPNATIYAIASGSSRPEVFRKPGGEPDPDAFSGEQRILAVRHEDYAALSQAAVGAWPDILVDPLVSQAERFSLLLGVNAGEAVAATRMLKPLKMIHLLARAGEMAHRLLSVGQVMPRSLMTATRCGPDWFAHAVSVSLYSQVLGVAMGMRDSDELLRLAQAAALHDIGLWPLYQNREAMTRDERDEAIARHPLEGFEMLFDESGLDRRQKLVVYQHHECPNGEGYPVGVLSDEIDPWAALVKVVDAFDEMTTVPSDPNRSEESLALTRLEKQAGANFDEEAVQCWTRMMRKQ